VHDFTTDWASLLINWRTRLIEYIKGNIEIDSAQKSINIRNKTDMSNLLVNHCQTVHGSKIYNRLRNVIVDSFDSESNELLSKTMVMNQEVDFTEFSYDIKMFKINRRSVYGQGLLEVGIETLAYHIEVFNLAEPDLIYKYRLPVKQQHPHDPLAYMVDVFNLINHSEN